MIKGTDLLCSGRETERKRQKDREVKEGKNEGAGVETNRTKKAKLLFFCCFNSVRHCIIALKFYV